MASSSAPLLNEVECPDHQNTVDVSLSKTSQCYPEHGNDEKQECGEHGEDEDEDEDDDFDFNPFLKETLSLEASSSLSSEIEGVEVDVDSGVGNSPLSVTALLSKPANQVEDYAGGDGANGGEVSVQDSVASDDASKAGIASASPAFQEERSTFVSRLENDTVIDKDNGLSHGTEVVNNVVLGDLDTGLQSTNVIMDIDSEDAICRRTRARYSLASFTLDELETFLQETDDEEDLPNVDDEAEYRKFLAAVLHGGNGDHVTEKENENIEDEDEDNDADFELEIEEALESDVDESSKSPAQEQNSEGGGRRPETRQNKRKKSSAQLKKKSSGHLTMPLRPLLPNIPVLPYTAFHGKPMMLESPPHRQPSSAYYGSLNGFTPHQIGQLHCLMHEHVQLLIQVYSLCIFEPSKENIATQTQGLILEILEKRNQVLTWRTTPYPSSYFFPPYIRPSVPNEDKITLPIQDTSLSFINASERNSCPENNIAGPSDNGRHKSVSTSKEDRLHATEGPMWMPFTNGHVLSILDVAPLNIAKSYMDDVSFAAQEYKRRHVGDACDTHFEKEPLFPLKTIHFSADEVQRGSEAVSEMPSSGNGQGPKKTLAGTLAAMSKKQSVAPVPKKIAKLARIFFYLFNPSLFPHKPPPVSVANRVLFTDAEDMLLASGLMEYNTDWKAIQQCFLPCKSKHQIFVRQKNRSCSRAPENPIKAVRRLKNSPLTAEETARIKEGLMVFKNDWMSVWKKCVPYRDPFLLPRQWRVASGTQKSYKVDEQKKKKRRLYELNRRKGNPENFIRWHSSSEKEDCSAGEENNSGNDCMDNENEAYVHEAFLADWRPDTSGVSLELPTSNCGVKSIPNSSQEDCHNKEQRNNSGFRDLQCQIGQQFSYSLKHSHPLALSHGTRAESASSSHLNDPFSDVHLKSSRSQPLSLPYKARRSRRSRLVKLAPGLPPVNLPPSVRVMSQSAFKSYQGNTSSSVSGSQNGFAGPSTPNAVSKLLNVAQSGTTDPIKSGHTSSPLQSSISHLHPEDRELRNRGTVEDQEGSDLHMHPLLFRTPEDRRLPYYPLNCSSNASSSFNFFPRNQPLLNLSLFHNPKQANYSVSQSGKSPNSIEKSAPSFGIDFHPLLQRSSDVNSSSICACPVAELSRPAELSGVQHAQSQESVDAVVSNIVPVSILDIPSNPSRKMNELDLDIHLSCTSTKQIYAESRNAIKENIMREPRSAHVSGIRDIQNTKNPSKHPTGSSSEAIPPVIGQNVDSVAHASLQTNHYISRDFVDNTPNQSLPEIVMEQEELSDSEEEITKDVEFECEEMTDSEGEEASDCERIDSQGIEELSNIVVNKVALDGDSSNQHHESRPHCEPDHTVRFSSEGSKRKLKIEDRKKDNPTSPFCLNLNSCPASNTMKPKQHAVVRNPRRSTGKNKLDYDLNRLCKVTKPSNKNASSARNANTTQKLNVDSVISPSRRPRKGARRSTSSLYVAQDESCGTVMAVDISNHVNNRDCCDPHIP